MELVKYQRTYHFDFSPGLQNDDRRLESIEQFVGKEIVVTEKLDGENTSMYPRDIHARSLSSGMHPSRTIVRAIHGNIKHLIPEGMRICGENLYAKHSIEYKELPAYFLVFNIYQDGIALPWDDIVSISAEFGLQTVPILYRGFWDESKVKACYTGKSVYGGEQEGYVVRITSSYPQDEHNNIGKYVRKNHVTTGPHWMTQAVIPNGLRKKD